MYNYQMNTDPLIIRKCNKQYMQTDISVGFVLVRNMIIWFIDYENIDENI